MFPRFLAVLPLLVGIAHAGPILRNDTVTINARQSASIPVLRNDSKGISRTLVRIAKAPKYGTATVNPDGTILYRNTKGASSIDAFRYKLRNSSRTALVTVRLSKTLRVPPFPTTLPLDPGASSTYTMVDAFDTTFDQPVCLATPPGEASRLFVLEKTGAIKLVADVTVSTSTAVTTFLDLPALLATRGETVATDSEQGLLGLAFHPQYASNGYFYVFYSAHNNQSGNDYQRVSRFTVSNNDPGKANPASELILLNQFDEAGNHNGGCLQFGSDGYLYISVGDEGAANDSLNNSQRIDKDFFSGILRIDVDKLSGNLAPKAHASIPLDNGVARFSVPSDNPFVSATSFNGITLNPNNLRTEFWAVGLRNPWRFSFDNTTGELWCADVGQNAWEEVDLITRGGNYGWAYREGKHAGPKTPPSGFTSISPIVEHGHGSGPNQGNSITGGLVYRGSQLASLIGAYVYADYATGNVWSLRKTSDGPIVTRLMARGGIAAFGADPSNGDILACNINEGKILRLIQSVPNNIFPATLTATNIFASVKTLSPNPGFVAYSPNVPFWSDYAIKSRWFRLPASTSQIDWSQDAPWITPTGTIWVKHFDLETTRGNPATKRRVETRVLVRNDDGVYGLTYQWNSAQTEAYLVPEEGADLTIPVNVNGTPTNQAWHIPGRSECLTCHTPQGGYSLSFNTRQFNHGPSLNGIAGNQIDVLKAAGYFSTTVPDAVNLPRHYPLDDLQFDLENRVRSYLAVNCAYCHQSGGTAPTQWDGRPELTLEETGLINGPLSDDGGDSANKLVVPGDPAHSVILSRIEGTHGFSRMPPLGTNQIDPQAVNIVTDWIQNYLPQHP